MKIQLDLTPNEAWNLYKRRIDLIGKRGPFHEIYIDSVTSPNLEFSQFCSKDVRWTTLVPKSHQKGIIRLKRLIPIVLIAGISVTVAGLTGSIISSSEKIDIVNTPYFVGLMIIGSGIIAYSSILLDRIRQLYKDAKVELSNHIPAPLTVAAGPILKINNR